MTDPVGGIPMMRIMPPPASSAASAATNATGGSGEAGTDFGGMLRTAVESAMRTGHAAETQAIKAVTEGGNVTEVTTALAQAELTLQTATAVRDRMLQAYQDIMRIQI